MKTKKDAIRVILDDTKAFETSLNYAVGYCDAAMLMTEGTHEFEIQCLYILSNLSRWRHKEANAVRKKLRERVQPCCNLIAPAVQQKLFKNIY